MGKLKPLSTPLKTIQRIVSLIIQSTQPRDCKNLLPHSRGGNAEALIYLKRFKIIKKNSHDLIKLIFMPISF